jgi:polyferredoxin
MNIPYKPVRRLSQLLFLAACLIIAVEFQQFASALERGVPPSVERPPGVDAFLPISGLMGLKYYLTTGTLNPIHPSAVLILGFALAVSLGVARCFCSWVCPIGLLSEGLYELRRKLGFRGLAITGKPDIVLRSLKYLILLFFVYAIFFKMGGPGLAGFINSAFHITADIKMLHFFSGISPGALGILAALAALSFVFPYFWCRYLCPYGALMGLAGLVSPVRIRRRKATCTSCGRCDRACPGRIKVSLRERVVSDECLSCGRCADACPQPDTLCLGPGRRIMPAAVVFFILIVFWGGSLAARRAGVWQNRVSLGEYYSAMLETGLLDLNRVENPKGVIRHLDRRGKRLLMQQMVQMAKKD